MKLTKEGISGLNQSIEETKRKRKEVEKEVIIRAEQLLAKEQSQVTIDGIEKQNEMDAEEIEEALIRSGFKKKVEVTYAQQVIQTLNSLFEIERIRSTAEIQQIENNSDMNSVYIESTTKGKNRSNSLILPQVLKFIVEHNINLSPSNILTGENIIDINKAEKIKLSRLNFNINELISNTKTINNIETENLVNTNKEVNCNKVNENKNNKDIIMSKRLERNQLFLQGFGFK